MMYCSNCGAQIVGLGQFCSHCGVPVVTETVKPQPGKEQEIIDYRHTAKHQLKTRKNN